MSTELINRPAQGYQLNAFFGGDARGRCLQITGDNGHLQLTPEAAALLFADVVTLFLEPKEPAEAFARRPYVHKACEELDAAIFSGDVLWDEGGDFEALAAYVASWFRAVAVQKVGQ